MRKYYSDCLVRPFLFQWVLVCVYCVYINIYGIAPFSWNGLAHSISMLMGLCFVWAFLVGLSLLPVFLLNNEDWRDRLLCRYVCWWALPVTGSLLLLAAIYRTITNLEYRYYSDDLLLLTVLFIPYIIGIWISWRRFNKAYPL